MLSQSEIDTLVTGAGGFVGGWICEYAALCTGRPVRAGLRSWTGAGRLARFRVPTVFCDVCNPEAITLALQGVGSVVHCAVGGHDVTVDGTRNILQGCLEAGVRRFVYISTAEVYGDVRGTITEDTPFGTATSPYAIMKRRAEELCWEYQSRGMDITVLRPAIVYGPFSTMWTVGMAKRLSTGLWRSPVARHAGICNLVYAADLAQVVDAVLRQPATIGGVFNVTHEDVITWHDYFAAFNAALGGPELRGETPMRGAIVRHIGRPGKRLAKAVLGGARSQVRALGRAVPWLGSTMTRGEGALQSVPTKIEDELYARPARYSSERLSNVLGYTAPTDLKAGVTMSVAWLHHHGVV